MRGKLPLCYGYTNYRGITPADAGKTFVNSFILLILWDHPRGCGENGKKVYLFAFGRGSPPRMRGKRILAKRLYLFPRITPADAGKTIIYHRMHSESRDHPRGCGENSPKNNREHLSRGSPLRMRGKLCNLQVIDCSPRITPADAGKTD